MPGRDLLVRVRADISDFSNKMRLAQGQVAGFDKGVQAGTNKSGKALNALGLSYAGVGAIAGTVAVAGIGKMISAAADFDQAMSHVSATGIEAKRNIGALRDAAIEAGNATAYSALEAAGGVEALLKAGVSADEVLNGGLKGALSLAAAGNLDVAQSAEAAAAAMSQFSLSGEDVPHIADLLAAAAGKANGEVSDMAQALNQAGLVASGAGASIEETTGTLAAFAESGLLGSDAGTSFKTMLQRLQNPLGAAAGEMKRWNISAYDANGNFVGLAKIAGQLRTAFKGQTDETRNAALATIFGSDAVRAANVLYNEGGDGIKSWTTQVNDAGFAAETAAEKQDNLRGDLEKLKGTLDTVFIKGGSGGQGPLRDFVQDIDAAIKAIDELNGKSGLLGDVLGQVLNGTPQPGGKNKPFSIASSVKDLFQADRLGRPESFGAPKTLDVPFRVRLKIAQGGTADELAKLAKDAGIKPREMKIALKIVGTGAKEIAAVEAAMKRASRIKMLQGLGYTGKGLKDALKDLETIDKGAKKPKKVKLDVDAKSGIQQAGFLQKELDKFGKAPKPPKLSVKDLATPTIRKIQNDMARVKSKEVTITTRYKTIGTPPGPWMGGRVGAWAGQMGFAGGGIVPGSPPSDPRQDNVFARDEGGRGLAVRSGEWIINEQASRLNDRLLRAINSGADFSGFNSGGRVNGGSSSSGGAVIAQLVDNRVAMDRDGVSRLVDDRVQVWFGAEANHAKQSAGRRRVP